MKPEVRFGTVAVALAIAVGSINSSMRAQGDPALARDFDAFLGRVMALDGTPGLAVAVVRGAEVVYAKGFGFADREAGHRVRADTQFYLASTSKSTMGLTAAILASRGQIDLDTSVSRALPAARFHPDLRPDTITLRDLLTHTHGIQGGPIDFRLSYTGDAANAVLLDVLARHAPLPSGKAFVYSNLGYNIFGLALDAKLPEGWKAVVRREVFDPIGMTRTTAFRSKADVSNLALPYELTGTGLQRVEYLKQDSNISSAGGDLSTVNDLARYLIAHLNSGRVGGRQAVPAAAIAETHRKQADQNRMDGTWHRFGWGLGWDLATYGTDTVLSRTGSFTGFFSHISFMPEKHVGLVVLSNGGSAGGRVIGVVADYVYDRMSGRADLAPRADAALVSLAADLAGGKASLGRNEADRRARPQETPLPIAAYAGTYENPGFGRMVWTLEGGRLHVRMGVAHSVVEAFNGPQNQFRVELTGNGMVIEFEVPAGARQPTSLQFMNQRFVRVK